MDIVKKNLVSFICLIIAIVAVVANFYPMAGKRDQLRADASAHAAKAGELKSLLTKQRNLPTVKPGENESEPLNGFPTHDALEKAHSVTELVNKSADSIMTKASGELNIHVPLVDRALPGQPGETLPASSFAREYISMFPPPTQNGTIAVAMPAPTTRQAGLPPTLVELLHAGMPPTDLDLQTARDAKQKQIEGEAPRDTNGNMTNPQDVQDSVNAAFKTLADDMRKERAAQCKVYVAPDAFSLYPGMIIGAQPQPSDIFWAQIGLWVQEDICKGIAETNARSANVMDAPVKELEKVLFVNPNQPGSQAQLGPVPVFVIPNLPVATGVGQGNGPEMAAPAPAGDQSQAPQPFDPNPDLTKTHNTLMSPSGRISNGLFDVVQFDVSLIADAGSVPQVIEGLGANRYISVIQLQSIESVDSALYRAGGYYFGAKPCVRIKVRCEELFFRSWLANYVPARLKTLLQYAAPPAPPSPT